uniref:Uncharacterized protein n=1 Tax=Aegilops tauschii subsp. strangulata TaxID=200361 RepID=A0A453RM44_AEGTS
VCGGYKDCVALQFQPRRRSSCTSLCVRVRVVRSLRSEMAVPLLTRKIVKKRVKHFKRAHSDRYIGLKVSTASARLLCSGCCKCLMS